MAVGTAWRGRRALVTGAAKRIGRAIALALASHGADVVVHHHRSVAEALALCQELENLGVRAWAVEANLERPEEADGLTARVSETAGPIDILVNNAAVFRESTVLNFTPADLTENINLHALAPLLLSRGFAAQAREGVIVNLLDARVVDYDRQHAAYHLSKRMLLDLTSMLALELAPQVRVNGVAPGLILPPAGKDTSYLESLAHTNPLEAFGRPEDIVAAVLFLVESRFVTGQVIYVDGGRHLKGRVYG